MRRETRLVLALGAAAVLALASASGAGSQERTEERVLAESSQVTVVQDGDWVRHRYATTLEGAERFRYQGERSPHGGCTYSGTETADPSTFTGVIEERQVAHNAETCVLVTERGKRAGTADEPMAKDVERAEPATADTGSAAPAAPMALANRTAWHRTYYEDPPGLDVNGARTTFHGPSTGRA